MDNSRPAGTCVQVSHKKNTCVAPKKSKKQPRKLETDWRSKFAAQENTVRKQDKIAWKKWRSRGYLGVFVCFKDVVCLVLFLVLFWFGGFVIVILLLWGFGFGRLAGFCWFFCENTIRQLGSFASRVSPEVEKDLCQCLVREPQQPPSHRRFQAEKAEQQVCRINTEPTFCR